MKIKKIIAIVLACVGMLSANAAETLATPLIVEQGQYGVAGGHALTPGGFLSAFFDDATFSGDGFAVSHLFTNDINEINNVFDAVFRTGALDVQFGLGVPANGGTIQVGDVSCQIGLEFAADCGATLSFVHTPLPAEFLSHEAAFTMTGQLVLGQVGLPNLIVDIEGSGIVTGSFRSSAREEIYNARYEFAVPEPSSALLLFTGVSALLVARRRRRSPDLCDRA